MNKPLKTFLAEIKRLYNIFFENRKPEDIQEDYHNNKWISKSELIILLEYEKQQMVSVIKNKEKDYNDLLESYNLNSLAHFDAVDRKYQSKLKKLKK